MPSVPATQLPVRREVPARAPFAYPLTRVPAVDAVALEERAAALATRSIKGAAKLWALETALRMVDLTTLEGADTPGKVRALCRKAVRPDPLDPSLPHVAAVCVYPDLVPVAARALAGSGVRVASVATGFPAGQTPLSVKLAEVREAVAMGAEEIDMVIHRGAFLAGEYARVFDEVARTKEACGEAHLKAILEVGELGTYDNVRKAAMLAMAAGADFVKTSTGKLPRSSSLPAVLVMLEAVREFHEETGAQVGVKAAGGVSAAKSAIQYLVLVHEVLGAEWLTPDLFRIGASTLVNDLLMQIRKQRSGAYQSPDYFTLD
ncbi:MAG: deoxyribose-phosphate aldolase [Gemmatimonadota bacterium]